MTKSDREYMLLAIEQARLSRTEDNRIHPKVGVIVIKNGTILAKGHRGEIESCQHAEYGTLELKLGRDELAGSTVFTTLEPCTTRNHPKVCCAKRIIERKIKRVVIGMLDPNKQICGQGIRALRAAGVATDLFPPGLMAYVEEQNRDFTRAQESLEARNAAMLNMCQDAGLTYFIPSRDHYRLYRTDNHSIDGYIDSANQSVVMVSINLMTGVPFNGLCQVLSRRLSDLNQGFQVTISVLNPSHTCLMEAIAPVLDITAPKLATSITDSIKRLQTFRSTLTKEARGRLQLLMHNSIPFGSAILLDHMSPGGRVQIETKAYKAPIRDSFAFEIVRARGSQLYETLVQGYTTLIRDGSSF